MIITWKPTLQGLVSNPCQVWLTGFRTGLPDLLADLRNSLGRFVTIYAVTPEDRTWTRIFSGSRRLLAHKIYAAMSRIVRANNKNYG